MCYDHVDLHGGIIAKLRQVGTLGGEAKGPTPRLVKLQPPLRAALPGKQFNAAPGRHTEVVVMVVVMVMVVRVVMVMVVMMVVLVMGVVMGYLILATSLSR